MTAAIADCDLNDPSSRTGVESKSNRSCNTALLSLEKPGKSHGTWFGLERCGHAVHFSICVTSVILSGAVNSAVGAGRSRSDVSFLLKDSSDSITCIFYQIVSIVMTISHTRN